MEDFSGFLCLFTFLCVLNFLSGVEIVNVESEVTKGLLIYYQHSSYLLNYLKNNNLNESCACMFSSLNSVLQISFSLSNFKLNRQFKYMLTLILV